MTTPRATIRLQFHKGFRFADATELVPYFAALGISHIYASPFLQARAGSTHGYDITDHTRFNPEIGSEQDFDSLTQALHAHGMGLILDFVPNHMGVGGTDNPWWLDVLEWGQASPYARFFDIDWQRDDPALNGKLLLPSLGDHYGRVLERGELQVRFDEINGTFSAWYYDSRFPIAPRNYPHLLGLARGHMAGEATGLADLSSRFQALDTPAAGVQAQATVRQEAAQLKQQLAQLVAEDAVFRQALHESIDHLNTTPAELNSLLESQTYRVAYWRVASDEINYRRFFDVNDLAGLRIEQPELFELAHTLIFRLIAEGKLQGLRLDHIDGLFNPLAYCRKLQDRVAYLQMQHPPKITPERPQPRHPLYLLVEKILAPHESLRADWPVDGTTGYEVMNLLNGLFVNSSAERLLTETYEKFLGRTIDYREAVLDAKRLILDTSLASEANVLVNDLHTLARTNLNTRDFTASGMRRALVEVIAHFPIYRTYITADGIASEDRRDLDWAFGAARRHTALADTSIFDFLYDVLSGAAARRQDGSYDGVEVMRIAMKFQQLTGPVMAKSLEDTVFYRYARLISLNEVGGEPEHFGVTVASFHRASKERLAHSPFSLLATATHDHKRGEDARTRIDVLSEMPDEWTRRVRRWSHLNRARRREVDGLLAPGRNDEYLFYQTLVGAWPLELTDIGREAVTTVQAALIAAGDDNGVTEVITSPEPLSDAVVDGLFIFADRMVAYMIKAMREAKRRSSWSNPNTEYEQAVEAFVRGVLDPQRGIVFLRDFAAFHSSIARIGAVNSLSQTLLKLTMPGVPDLYQGTEFWDLSLVDPDNRRPVDWGARQTSLKEEGNLLQNWRDGRIKQHIIATTLNLRRKYPALFAEGDYISLDVTGTHNHRIIAFARHHQGQYAITIAPRLIAPLMDEGDVPLPGFWEDTAVIFPEDWGADWQNVLASSALKVSGSVPVRTLLEQLPVGLFSTGQKG